MAVIIELGEIGQDGDVPNTWRPQVEVRQRLLLLAAAALILFWVTGSAPRVPRLAEPLWSTRASGFGFVFGTDSVYAVEPGAQAVSAFDPVTGDRRWRVELDSGAQEVAEVGPGLLALQLGPPFSDTPGPGGQPGDLAVLLLGPYGRVIARVPGQLFTAVPDGRLLVIQPRPGCAVGDCTQLSRIDPATGAVTWSLPAEDRGFPAQSCQSNTFAVFGGDTVQIRSMVNGDMLEEMHVLNTDIGLLQSAVLYADELVIAELIKGGVIVSGQPLLPGGRSWSITLPQGPTPDGVSSGLFFATCGPLLTAQLANSTAIIDRHTGAVRMMVPGDLFVVPELGAGSSDGTDGAGILLALSGPSATATSNVVLILDAANGARLAYYPDTGIVPWTAARGRAMLTHEANGRTGFTAVDDRGRPSALGDVDGTDLTCRARADLLSCASADGIVRVWRLPPYALP